MKKLLYLLLFNFSFWNYGLAQIFQEDFQTVSPEYGTNVNSGNICPSISFIKGYNQKIDCLENWRIYKGTPSIGNENGNTYLSMWSQKLQQGNEFKVLTEMVYLNGYKLEPNTNYRLEYYVKSEFNSANGYASFNAHLTTGLEPYYYGNWGPCGGDLGDNNGDVPIGNLDSYRIPNNGTSNWVMRTVYFSTESETEYTLSFFPIVGMYNYSSTQLIAMLDNVSLYKEGECESKTVFLQNKTISPKTILPITTIQAKRIYAGRAIIDDNDIPYGDVVVKPNGILNLNSTYTIDLFEGFIVEEGGIFDAYVDGSCYPGNGTFKTASEEDEAVEEIISDNGTDVLNKITVYPNPSNGQFTLTAAKGIDEIVIYNSLGQEVKGIIDSKNKSMVEVNLTNKVKGVYFLRIRSDNECMDKKIVIE
jgi:hypothetical protein